MGFFKSLENLKDTEPKFSAVRFSTIEYNYDTILENIKNGTFSNAKIEEMIVANSDVYLNYDNFTNKATRKVFQLLWTEPRFLRNFLSVLTKHPEHERVLKHVKQCYKITINRIAYDYYASSKDKDTEVCDLLLNIAYIVDIDYIKPLMSIMDETTAKFMALFNFSSNDTETCIEHLNNLIVKAGYDFSVKDIVYIYSRFYSEGFSQLFNYTMTSVQDDLKTPIEKHNYDRISLAIINILNNMTENDIYRMLSQFSSYITLMQKGTVRFSLRGLSNDFYRINEAVQNLLEDGTYIP